MRKRGKRIVGLGLSLALITGCAAEPYMVGNAAEAEVIESTEDKQPVEQKQEDQDMQTSKEESQESQGQNNENGVKETEQTVENPASEMKESEAERGQAETDSVQVQTKSQQTSKEALPEVLKENSWRYKDGQPIYQTESGKERAAYPYAWKKVNGKFMNDRGQVIEGAVKKGIDVSHHQVGIDWEKVKKDGIDYAIIRCGYGGNYTSQDDREWLKNVEACERLGIPYGVYLYSYANDVEDAKSEADHVLRLLKGHNPTYPVYYDLEDKVTEAVSNSTIGMIAKTFCDKVSAAGYDVGIYANKYWWENKLTSSVFNNSSWSRWVAQYNSNCTYKGDYDMWQCTSTGTVNGIYDRNGNLVPVDLNFWMGFTYDMSPVDVSDRNIISSSAHVSIEGWLDPVQNGYQLGITGQSKAMEALKINVGSGYGDLGIRYRAHVADIGWQNYVTTGQTAGTTGKNKAMQAVNIELTGTQASKYDIYYRAHVADYGWLGWAKNGAPSGTVGYGKQLEALQIVVLPKGAKAPGSMDNAYKEVDRSMAVSYQAHMQDYGWCDTVKNGAIAGITGKSKRMEALKVQLNYPKYDGDIQYRAYVEDEGWQSWKKNGANAGTTGEKKRMEAIQMNLTGTMAQKYDLYYRVHVQNFGWLGWTKNGASAGTVGYDYRMEGIQVQLVEKGKPAPGSTTGAYKEKVKDVSVNYETHMQDYGWMTSVKDGAIGGVTGKSKRMEAIKIQLKDQKYTGNIQYRTHVQNDGWQSWKENGTLSGTTGQKKRMEAIQIKLTGEMAKKYDVYYKVHSQNYGWLGWAKNGESAGTEGLALRMEGIQVQLVEKGTKAPEGSQKAFIKK